MEGKTVILSVLIMFLIMAQIQVEARRVCCRTRRDNITYIRCRRRGGSRLLCLRRSGCILVPGNRCPRRFPNYETLENSGGDDVNEYCNLGCESSVCGALTNLENSDASEAVNEEALEKCTKACSTLCAKGFQTAADQIELNQIALDQIALDQIARDQTAVQPTPPVASKSCCPTRAARRIYDRCRRSRRTPAVCARLSSCRSVAQIFNCPPCCPFSGPTVNEYCNLGCESSVCGALTNLENSDASEIAVNEALEKCTKACSTLCATGSNTTLDQITLDDPIAPDQIA